MFLGIMQVTSVTVLVKLLSNRHRLLFLEVTRLPQLPWFLRAACMGGAYAGASQKELPPGTGIAFEAAGNLGVS